MAHEEYLRRNLIVARSYGVTSGLSAAITRLTALKKPPLWMLLALYEIQKRAKTLPSELVLWRDAAPDSPDYMKKKDSEMTNDPEIPTASVGSDRAEDLLFCALASIGHAIYCARTLGNDAAVSDLQDARRQLEMSKSNEAWPRMVHVQGKLRYRDGVIKGLELAAEKAEALVAALGPNASDHDYLRADERARLAKECRAEADLIRSGGEIEPEKPHG